MPQPSLALIADDLTGALDAAGPFVMARLRCLVATSIRAGNAGGGGARRRHLAGK